MEKLKAIIKRVENRKKVKIKCIDIRNGESFRFLEYLENKEEKKEMEKARAHRFY